MPEYIERDAAIKSINQLVKASDKIGNHDSASVYASAASLIDDLPAADVAPVVHARWKWYEEWTESTPDGCVECDTCGWECSECGISISQAIQDAIGETVYCDDYYNPPKMRVCPSCHAVMSIADGGEQHD